MANRVEFVSYSGRYPNLCSGTLVLKIDGETVNFGSHCLMSGGAVWFDDEWVEQIDVGPWSVNVPNEYRYLANEIETVVNENVEWGCCGGCV